MHRRNKIFKLNVAIRDGMIGVKKLKFPMKRRKLAAVGRVNVDVLRFPAVADEQKGPEWFMTKAKAEKLNALYDTLKELGAEAKTETKAWAH